MVISMFKTVTQKVALAASTMFLSAAVFAQQATSPASDAMDSIKSEANSLISDAWPILVAVVVAGVGMKLFKKFAGKAT